MSKDVTISPSEPAGRPAIGEPFEAYDWLEERTLS